jgi:hypothetical protein
MHLKKSLDATSGLEKYKTSRKLFHCKMAEGSFMITGRGFSFVPVDLLHIHLTSYFILYWVDPNLIQHKINIFIIYLR